MDEPIARRGLRRLLRNEPDVEVVGECADGREAVAALEELNPDLVFLDVHMLLMGGFEVVETVGTENVPAVVFVTAYDEHAIRAFEVHALDYLLKPIDPQRFQKTLKRVREQADLPKGKRFDRKLSALLESVDELRGAQLATPQRVVIREQGRISLLNTDDIDWLCAQGNYVQLHAGREIHLLRGTVDAMEPKLDPRKFVRLRRSTIVRAERIKELHPLFNGEYAVILKNRTRLQSSRRYRRNLDELLKVSFDSGQLSPQILHVSRRRRRKSQTHCADFACGDNTAQTHPDSSNVVQMRS